MALKQKKHTKSTNVQNIKHIVKAP